MVTIMIVAPSLCNTHCGVTRRKPATVVLAIVLYMKKQLTKKKSQQLGQVNYAGVWERNQPTGAESMKSNINFD